MPGHRRSIRLRGHDYTQPGAYYVTLPTQAHACIFGRVVDDEMQLNALREIARDCWLEIPDHVPGVRLDAWIVMPNHLHGILWLDEIASPSLPARASHGSPLRRAGRPCGAPARSLGAIIALYKGASGRRINKLLGQPGARVWHRDYHDHVICHEAALIRIRRYIELNPSRWDRDRINPDKLATRVVADISVGV
jgi:REP element-mobilizing transposase RayT